MTRFWIAASLMVAVLALASSRSAHGFRDEDKEVKEAQKAVLDLTKAVADGKDEKAIAGQAAAIKKKYEELNTVMHIYKPKAKGGIGYGKAGEGIELKIIGLGKRALAAGSISKEKDDLVNMANINIAMAAVTRHYAPAKPKGGKGKKDWEQYTDDMKKASLDLIKAAKAGKAADIKAAANNMNNACNNCHTDFRDS